jgi:hypothetical protein
MSYLFHSDIKTAEIHAKRTEWAILAEPALVRAEAAEGDRSVPHA